MRPTRADSVRGSRGEASWLKVCRSNGRIRGIIPQPQHLDPMASHTPILDHDVKRETISSEPDEHPVGTGIGAVGGAVAGAFLGSAGGPVGAFIGGAVGALAGGIAGKEIAEEIDPAAEDEFWRENYRSEPYYDDVYTYQDYGPAYRAGYSAKAAGGSKTFEEAEPQLRGSWENINDRSSLTWDRAKAASRAAWDRVERAIPGDADRDGK